MKIYFNGDSHTSGSELQEPEKYAYSYRIADKLHATVVGNPAVGGAGNDRIFRLTNKFLDKCEESNVYPDLVIIGWSETARFDWFVNGEYRTLNSEEDGLPETLGKKLDPKRITYQSQHWAPTKITGLIQYQHNQMFNLHLRLNHLNIKHLFFNAVHSFINLREKGYPSLVSDQSEILSLRLAFNWEGTFWNPYEIDGSFLDWGRSQKFHITPFWHLGIDAHEKFSDVLIDYMREQNII